MKQKIEQTKADLINQLTTVKDPKIKAILEKRLSEINKDVKK